MTKEIKTLIEKSKNIAIFFHINPDGDAIGSSLALKEALEQLGKNVDVFSQDEIGDRLWFLKTDEIKTECQNKKYDLAFVLDCGEIKRIGTMEKVLKNCENIINIDHHLNNENFTKFQVVNSDASSTCEILYYFLKELKIDFTKSIKISLYTGLATDSGCFLYNITNNLYEVAENLCKDINEEIEKINYTLFREKKLNQLKLTAETIQRLESFFDNSLALTYILQKDLQKYDVEIDYTPCIIFSLSGLENYKIICVICEEKEGVFRVSFRSANTDVCNFARLFGGGGHKFASGCKIYGNKNSVKKKIIEKAKEYLKCTE